MKKDTKAMKKPTRAEIKKGLAEMLKEHECGELWGCYKCYYRNPQPCVEYEILKLAKKAFEYETGS